MMPKTTISKNNIDRHNIYKADIKTEISNWNNIKRADLIQRMKSKYQNHFDIISFTFAISELVESNEVNKLPSNKEAYYIKKDKYTSDIDRIWKD